MKLLLDTNVLIDYYARRAPYFEDCVRLRVMQAFGDAELWVPAKSFTDAFYVLQKFIDPKLIQEAFVESSSFFKICSVGADDVLRATTLSWQDFEDCLIDICAQKVKADYILTRDAVGFEQAKTPCMHPKDFLALIAEDKHMTYAEVAL